jgi:hypothetical protein
LASSKSRSACVHGSDNSASEIPNNSAQFSHDSACMNSRDKVLADKIADLGGALLDIVDALKSQPGFDRTAFDTRIRECIARRARDRNDSFINMILSHALDDSPPTRE